MHHLSWSSSTGCQSVAQNSVQTVYFNVWHQPWCCSTISVRTRPALWRHPASLQCARQLCRFTYSASCNWQSLLHRWATCLECIAIWHETDLISYQHPQEAQDTLLQSHLVETFISFYMLLLVIAARCNRCGHYRPIFVLWFLLSSLFSVFPRLISAVVHWMSTILPHIMWP